MDALDDSVLDVPTFEQILVCDEGDDDSEFSKSVVFQFIEQADRTIPELQKLLDERRLEELSKRGHFLKGSSAQLGVKRVRAQCELVQHYAALEDFPNTSVKLARDAAVQLLIATMQRLHDEYRVSRAYLKKLYGETGDAATPASNSSHGSHGTSPSASRATQTDASPRPAAATARAAAADHAHGSPVPAFSAASSPGRTAAVGSPVPPMARAMPPASPAASASSPVPPFRTIK